VARILRSSGHDVHTPTLTGLGERHHLVRPDVDLETHIEDIINVLFYEDLEHVILVGHSYGGMVITGVADRLPERVDHLVYLDGALPEDGESLASMNPLAMEPTYAGVRTVEGVELVLWPDPDADSYFGVTNPDDVAWMRARLSPHPWKSFAQPLHLQSPDAVKRLPRTNINCTETLMRRPPERQARAFDADNVWEIDTGHDLMITEPGAVAEMLMRIAAKT
jgi:pimeloyl-ACP methyl ester carboxylesterase